MPLSLLCAICLVWSEKMNRDTSGAARHASLTSEVFYPSLSSLCYMFVLE
jgi:hypothetical protein